MFGLSLEEIHKFEKNRNQIKGKTIKAAGVVRVKDGIRLVLGHGFVNYYYWLMRKERGYLLQVPKHSSHLSIVLPKHTEKWNNNREKKARNAYHGVIVEFEYYPYGIFGGFTKGNFLNYWFKVKDNKKLNKIRRFVGLPKTQAYHITIANSKNF